MGKKNRDLSVSRVVSECKVTAKLGAEVTAKTPCRPKQGPEQTTVEHLVSAYHEQALSQARAQFWFSVIAAAIGFASILYAGMETQAEGIVSGTKILPGAVVDAVAYLFFRQASQTRQRATELYDRLRRDRQLSESVALVSSIEDLRLRSVMKAQVALHMSGLQPNPIDVSLALSIVNT